MYCTRCGTWMPDAAAACARCGEPRAAQAQHAPRVEGEEVDATAQAPEAVSSPVPAFRYGGFWRRTGASLVDALLLFFPFTILRVSLGLPTGFTMHALREDEFGRMLTEVCAELAVGWLYCALLESSRWRGTLGQQLLGMKLGDRSGARISFARASGRYFAQYISITLCCIGYLFNLWTARRQTLHDLIAGCVFLVSPPQSAGPSSFPAGEPS